MVEQILVTFNTGVILDPNAFSIVNLASSVTVSAGISPSTLPVSVIAIAITGSGNTQWILTFSGQGAIVHDNSATGTGGIGNISTTIADGFYQLHIDSTKVHATSLMATDNDTAFWALFGAGNPSEQLITNSPNFAGSKFNVASAGFQDLFDAYGSESDISPNYNAWYDQNLDGISIVPISRASSIITAPPGIFSNELFTVWSDISATRFCGALSVSRDGRFVASRGYDKRIRF